MPPALVTAPSWAASHQVLEQVDRYPTNVAAISLHLVIRINPWLGDQAVSPAPNLWEAAPTDACLVQGST